MVKIIRKLSKIEKLNFLLTNRIPRHFVTRFMGWYSKIQSPTLTKFSLKVWKTFAHDLDLSDAKLHKFRSLHDCFIRELKDGARTVDNDQDIVVSPCDAIVGACGRIYNNTVLQAKGFPYELHELDPSGQIDDRYEGGIYVTLRLKSSMYHRFHAPVDCSVHQVNYISGDTWNVNPIALKRIEKLFCKNERAIVELKTPVQGQSICLIPVAAILVASMKFHCLPDVLNLKYKGPNIIPCYDEYQKGDEMGYFQHGSTIILLASKGHHLVDSITTGSHIQMGQALLTLSPPTSL